MCTFALYAWFRCNWNWSESHLVQLQRKMWLCEAVPGNHKKHLYLRGCVLALLRIKVYAHSCASIDGSYDFSTQIPHSSAKSHSTLIGIETYACNNAKCQIFGASFCVHITNTVQADSFAQPFFSKLFVASHLLVFSLFKTRLETRFFWWHKNFIHIICVLKNFDL